MRFIRRWPLYTSMQRKRYVYPVELDARLQRAFIIMLFCNNCGAKLEPEDKFCGNCGAPVTQQKMFKTGKEILRTSPPPPAAHAFAQSTKRACKRGSFIFRTAKVHCEYEAFQPRRHWCRRRRH